MTHPLTIRLDNKEIKKLDELAKATDRKRSWHMSRAIKAYIEDESEFLESVREGITSADKGELVSHDDVAARLHDITGSDR